MTFDKWRRCPNLEFPLSISSSLDVICCLQFANLFLFELGFLKGHNWEESTATFEKDDITMRKIGTYSNAAIFIYSLYFNTVGL